MKEVDLIHEKNRLLNIKSNFDEEKLKRLLCTGNAIIFTGAGFSLEATNVLGQTPPLARDLALLISEKSARYLADIGAEPQFIDDIRGCSDLMIASDFYLQNIPQKEELLKTLKEHFTLKSVTEAHQIICGQKWRRIYTTNYDNSVELASALANIAITPLTLEDNPADHKNNTNVCLHINGKIDTASENDLDTRVKLTSSSYLSPDQFINSPWYRQFKSDVDHCSAVIFLGYSMYDIDIQRIFFNEPSIKDKSYFIVKENTTIMQNYKLAMLGEVLNIGIKGFASIVNECKTLKENLPIPNMISSMSLYQLHDEHHDIRDIEISNFLIFGNVTEKYIDQTTLQNDLNDKIIYREDVQKIISSIYNDNNIIILSDLGNGKSIICKTLLSYLTRDGYDCYFHLSNEYDFLKDLYAIAQNKRKSIVLIEDYSNHIDDVKQAIEQKFDNIQLIISTRHYGYENTKQYFHNLDMSNFVSFNVDYLSENEVSNFVHIVDNLGGWGDKAGLSNREKLRDLDDEARGQLSLLLLSILKSESIQSKINEITQSIFDNKRFKDTAFSILLLDVIGLPLSRDLISDIAMNDEIYHHGFLSNTGVQNIFRIERGLIKSKSSTLSRFLIAYHFDQKYVANQLLNILQHINTINESAKDPRIDRVITSLLRFSIVEKLLPQKRVEINYYYEKVKHVIPRLIHDPHYWVQYAMSVIPFKDYVNAQTYLDNAYSLASRRKGYHTKNIDTQQARLYLLLCLTKTGKQAFDDFKMADDIMKNLPNDIYKYRQIPRYKDIYEKVYSTFSANDKVQYEYALKRIVKESEHPDLLNELIYHTGSNWLDKIRDTIKKIVLNIEAGRLKK